MLEIFVVSPPCAENKTLLPQEQEFVLGARGVPVELSGHAQFAGNAALECLAGPLQHLRLLLPAGLWSVGR